MDTLIQRTKSDISLELFTKEATNNNDPPLKLPPLSEVELAKCECCGLSKECTAAYIDDTKHRFSGKLICGLCGEAVKEEMEKNGGRRSREEALQVHMNACVKFNRIGRVYPALYQAEDVRKILQKNRCCSSSINPSRDLLGHGRPLLPRTERSW